MTENYTFFINEEFITNSNVEVVSFQGYDYIPYEFCFKESDEPELTDDMFYLKENKNIYIQCCSTSCFLLHKWNDKDKSSKFIFEFQEVEEAMKNAVIMNDNSKGGKLL
tara:strand:+ start:880 stop:1206 length:327 start_codon:yes stop_codon:yes gene_type:complete